MYVTVIIYIYNLYNNIYIYNYIILGVPIKHEYDQVHLEKPMMSNGKEDLEMEENPKT